MSDTRDAAKHALLYIREREVVPDCWCPAEAVEIAEDIYRITRVRGGRALEFGVGDLVRCARRAFPDGSEALLALERAVPGDSPGAALRVNR
jgi:hypothetical protein